MFSPKKAGVSFVIGFIVSLIAGIGGGVSFIVLFFRAMLSGLFFAALVSGAMILYQKYLLNEESASDTVSQKTTLDQPGSNVDITLDDDELPDSASAPSFKVDMDLSSNPKSTGESLMPKLDDSFQVSSLDAIAASGENRILEKRSESSMQEFSKDAVEQSTVVNEESRNVVDTELDMLPDIESLEESDIGTSGSDDIIKDSVFAETGETKPIIPAGFSDMGDARDIAAAIRTALVKED